MRKIIVTRDPAKINLAVLKLVEQLGDLTSLSTLASDAEYARSQAVAAAAAAQTDQTAAAAAKAGAEAAQASAASSSGTAGAHASAASASATTALLAKDDAAIFKAGSEAAQAASEGARDASIVARDQSQAAKAASEAARDTVQSSIYIGPIAPTVTRSGMVWVDESANDLKIRNAANTAWLLLSDMIGAVEYDRAQSLTAPQQTQARTNIGASQISDNVRYDTAQGLSAAQKVMACANIGAAKAIAITHVSVPDEARFYVDFTAANGEVWRYISGSITKLSLSSPDYVVTYGFNFIGEVFPMVSNGDATAGGYYFMIFNNLAGSMTIAGRSDAGALAMGIYRANWTVFGRIL